MKSDVSWVAGYQIGSIMINPYIGGIDGWYIGWLVDLSIVVYSWSSPYPFDPVQLVCILTGIHRIFGIGDQVEIIEVEDSPFKLSEENEFPICFT